MSSEHLGEHLIALFSVSTLADTHPNGVIKLKKAFHGLCLFSSFACRILVLPAVIYRNTWNCRSELKKEKFIAYCQLPPGKKTTLYCCDLLSNCLILCNSGLALFTPGLLVQTRLWFGSWWIFGLAAKSSRLLYLCQVLQDVLLNIRSDNMLVPFCWCPLKSIRTQEKKMTTYIIIFKTIKYYSHIHKHTFQTLSIFYLSYCISYLSYWDIKVF